MQADHRRVDRARCGTFSSRARASLEALAKRLIEKEVIDADELKEIIDANSPSPLIVPGTDAERKRLLVEASDAAPPKSEQVGG